MKLIKKLIKNNISEFWIRKLKNTINISAFFLSIASGKAIRLFLRPRLPVNPDGDVYLHLGCGEIDMPGFINIDGVPWRHVHYVRSLDNLQNFDNETVDFIFSSHCLEHFSHVDIPFVLKEWHRVLKCGGKLCISVPDFDYILSIYNANNMDVNSIQAPLMGGQDYRYNFHKVVFTSGSLTKLLINAGFANVYRWVPDMDSLHSIDGWSKKMINYNGSFFPISLNLEAIK